jgi:hypothetical protein
LYLTCQVWRYDQLPVAKYTLDDSKRRTGFKIDCFIMTQFSPNIKYLCFLLSVLTCGSATAHVVPDGQIERSVQVVVRDRTVQIEIRVHLNYKTQRSILKQAETDGLSEAPLDETEQKDFQQWLAKQVTDATDVTINGNHVKIDVGNVVANPRRHVDYSIFVEAEVPSGIDEAKLVVDCNSLIEYPGNWRGAIKTKGNAMIGRTDEAPILIRAKPVDLVKRSKDERKKIESVSATILIPDA